MTTPFSTLILLHQPPTRGGHGVGGHLLAWEVTGRWRGRSELRPREVSPREVSPREVSPREVSAPAAGGQSAGGQSAGGQSAGGRILGCPIETAVILGCRRGRAVRKISKRRDTQKYNVPYLISQASDSFKLNLHRTTRPPVQHTLAFSTRLAPPPHNDALRLLQEESPRGRGAGGRPR
eukprot:COSAG05_NODE_1524_length_4640_cov_21.220656_4_plen_179_part_00